MRRVSNQEIAKVLEELAVYLEMEEAPFKPRAYERAAYAVSGLTEDLADVYAKEGKKGLMRIPGVGAGIALRIEELLKTGRAKDHERFKKKYPMEIGALISLEGLGPKMVKVLWETLRIRSIKDLARAAREKKIRTLPRLGEKFEAKILKAIDFEKRARGRFPIGVARPLVESIVKRLKGAKGVKEVVVCGSYRRWQETVGDIDILVTSDRPKPVMDYFASLPEVVHVYAKGDSKTLVRLRPGIDADLRVVPPQSFGAAVQYFTGDKRHNIKMRERAIKKGYKLNEYGLFKGKKPIAAFSEKDIYERLGLPWIPPEMRTDTGEIEAAAMGKLPRLIGYGDLRGDLQVTTDWTDGADSIEEMAEAAALLGHEYLAITDHTKSLAMTGGADEKKLLRQMKEIDRLNSKLKTKNSKLRILKSAEVNITKDGSLDIRDDVLAKLDVVGVAVHSHFGLPREEQTRRVIRAMENPHADILFHPTCRLVGRREPIALDMDAVIEAAKRTGTVLEIDADPHRLDLHGEYAKKAVEAGVMLAIDTDAHAASHLKNLEYGIGQARRGWVERKDVINAWPLQKMLARIKRNRRRWGIVVK